MFPFRQNSRQKWNEQIGKKIKEARESEDWTQKQLADVVEKKQESISDLERGRTEVGAFDLVLIAAALGKKITFFYEGYPSVLPTDPKSLTDEEEDLLKFYRQIQNPGMEAVALDQVKRLAKMSIAADNKSAKRRHELIAEEGAKARGKGLDAAIEAGQRGDDRFLEELERKKKRK